MNSEQNKTPAAKELSPEIRTVLMAIGRGLGTVSVYGTEHPSVQLIVEQAHEALKEALKASDISIGSFNGTLTVDEAPVQVTDIPIKTLEKRLISMKVSHLVLHAGLSEEELKQLLAALCAPDGETMKETLSKGGVKNIEMEDVKYVTLRDGEKKTGKGEGGGDEIPPAQVNQIVAFLKGQAASDNAPESVKKAISDPEKLGQMILEAAAVRQAGVNLQAGESLADIVIGCLRRTYDGLRKEPEFRDVQGKANLTKAMMLLEKSVLDKIHKSLGTKHPEIDRRIIKAIREMEEDRQFEVMAAHYSAQSSKLETVEGKIIDAIKTYGRDKAIQQFKEAGIPQKDWQRLLVQAGEAPAGPGGNGGGEGLPGVDMSALAVVLEKLEGLMQIETQDPAQMRNIVNVTKNGINNYTDRIETRIQELEGQIQLSASEASTVEHHADHLSREDLMLEISNLTLALVQPLTVVNASLEAAMKHVSNDMMKELLDLAYLSGQRMQKLSKRMMTLVGYPALDEVK